MEKHGNNGATVEKPAKELVLNPAAEDESSPKSICGQPNTYGEVNVEASIYADDVIRAGGFGATDNINSFLPVASDCDSTDFEARIRDARGYEEEQQETHRHGLGWTEPKMRK